MDAELKSILTAANDKTQYDTYAKKLLSEKCILAYILTAVVDEFKGMKPKEAEWFIEGEPYIGTVPTGPGLTNMGQEETKDLTVAGLNAREPGELMTVGSEEWESGNPADVELEPGGRRIVGLNTIHEEIFEGAAVFGVVLYARMPDGSGRFILNLEAQKDEPTAYAILNRAIFYMARLISSQKERDFTGRHYNDMKRVYSIWICMNRKDCTWNDMHLTDEAFLGEYLWRGNRELFHIIFLGVPDEIPGPDERCRLHRLLGALFSLGLSVDERISILENEYAIDMSNGFEEELKTMCNLGEGIWERGIEQGISQGEVRKARATAGKLYSEGWNVGKIAKLLDYRPETVREWLGCSVV